MIRGEFRPWGRLDWLLKHLGRRPWNVFGSIATGDRSLTTWRFLNLANYCQSQQMLLIMDVPTPFWGDEPNSRLQKRREEYLRFGGDENAIILCDIRDNLNDINGYTSEFLRESYDDIIIDISTLPKRFFFPIIRKILHETSGNTIVVTYTRPAGYDQAKPLAIDPEPWKVLPGFQNDIEMSGCDEVLIIGLGYEPLGLPQFLKEGGIPRDRVRLLFPFPATPKGYLRNWEFVRNLDSEVGPYTHEPIRVNGYDVSAIFDIIRRESDNGSEATIFAPYGPKPMSLSMCLYASMCPNNSSVFYTQPKSYNPNYSFGVRTVDGQEDIMAYCIRLNGKDLYNF